MLTVGSLFAGIGGFDLGFERAGFRTEWQVEIDPYCRKVLERHFPHAERFADIRDCGKHNLRSVDVICGGFPCQDISTAGKRAGIDGERSGLWSEMHRVICELRPRFVVVENVAALLNFGVERVLGDLAASGYDAEWRCLRASDFGALHRRDRIWIVAYPEHDGLHGPKDGRDDAAVVRRAAQRQNGTQQVEGVRHPRVLAYSESGIRLGRSPRDSGHATQCSEEICDTASEGLPDWAGGTVGQPRPLAEFERPGGEDVDDTEGEGRSVCESADIGQDEGKVNTSANTSAMRRRAGFREVELSFCGVAHGVSRRVDRLKGLGNAVVPQIATWIAERILTSISESAASPDFRDTTKK